MSSLVTKDSLRAEGACASGVAAFAAAFPAGIDVTGWTAAQQAGVLMSDLRRWWGWTVAHGVIPAWSMRRWDIKGANLAGANLAGADLADANLAGADLAGANLAGANLAGAYRTVEDPLIPGWRLMDGRLSRE